MTELKVVKEENFEARLVSLYYNRFLHIVVLWLVLITSAYNFLMTCLVFRFT
jgi:hypothetical protein